MKTMGQEDYHHEVEALPEEDDKVPDNILKDTLIQKNYIYIRNKYITLRIETDLKRIADNILEKEGATVRRRN